MIDFIAGKLKEIEDNYIVIETNGIGFFIFFPKSNMENLPSIDSDIKVYTYMAVKEDEMSLYGFLTKEDKEIFMLLISCNGVGPKGAMNIISELGFTAVIKAITNNNDKKISEVSGIGKKTASKICIELHDKVKKIKFTGAVDLIKDNNDKKSRITDIEDEATKALIKLGYKNKEAKAMVDKVDIDIDDTTQDIIKKVFRKK